MLRIRLFRDKCRRSVKLQDFKVSQNNAGLFNKKDQLSSYSREDSFVKERKTSYRKEGKKLPFPVKKKGSFEKIS